MEEIHHEVLLERSPAMRLLGEMITFRAPAFILNAVLLAAAVTLLIKTGFALVFVLLTIGFFFPMFLLIQFKYINRGGYLMRKTCQLQISGDTLRLRVGFPHSNHYNFREFSRGDVEKVVVKGSPTFGYYVEFQLRENEEEKKKEAGKEEKKKGTRNKKKDTVDGKKKGEQKEKKKVKEKNRFSPRFGLWRSVEECTAYARDLAQEIGKEIQFDYSLDDLTKTTEAPELN